MTDPTDTLRAQLRAANEALRVLREAASDLLAVGDWGESGMRGEDVPAFLAAVEEGYARLRAALSAPAPQSVEAPAPAAPPADRAEPKRDASEPGGAAAPDAEKRDVVAYEEHRIGSLPPYYARCGDMELTATWVVSPALGKAICDEMTERMRGAASEAEKDGGR